MTVIVPLAGPDFVTAEGLVKAEVSVDGSPLLRRVLDSRPWSVAATEYIFVLHDDDSSRQFANSRLTAWYPGCRTAFVSDYTAGAALSGAVGVALASPAAPIIVDLADIEFRTSGDPRALFSDPDVGAVGVSFESARPEYSYLSFDAEGKFVEAAEKRVISTHASAGVYLFRNASTYFYALSHALANPAQHTHLGLFYVCPLFNGVSALGATVRLWPSEKLFDIKIDRSVAP